MKLKLENGTKKIKIYNTTEGLDTPNLIFCMIEEPNLGCKPMEISTQYSCLFHLQPGGSFFFA